MDDNDVYQILEDVEKRKSSFAFNLIMLERDRNLKEISTFLEHVYSEGYDSEYLRIRQLVNQHLQAVDAEIKKNVEKEFKAVCNSGGTRKEPEVVQSSISVCPIHSVNEVRTRRAKPDITISSRLLQARSVSCDRCKKRQDQQRQVHQVRKCVPAKRQPVTTKCQRPVSAARTLAHGHETAQAIPVIGQTSHETLLPPSTTFQPLTASPPLTNVVRQLERPQLFPNGIRLSVPAFPRHPPVDILSNDVQVVLGKRQRQDRGHHIDKTVMPLRATFMQSDRTSKLPPVRPPELPASVTPTNIGVTMLKNDNVPAASASSSSTKSLAIQRMPSVNIESLFVDGRRVKSAPARSNSKYVEFKVEDTEETQESSCFSGYTATRLSQNLDVDTIPIPPKDISGATKRLIEQELVELFLAELNLEKTTGNDNSSVEGEVLRDISGTIANEQRIQQSDNCLKQPNDQPPVPNQYSQPLSNQANDEHPVITQSLPMVDLDQSPLILPDQMDDHHQVSSSTASSLNSSLKISPQPEIDFCPRPSTRPEVTFQQLPTSPPTPIISHPLPSPRSKVASHPLPSPRRQVITYALPASNQPEVVSRSSPKPSQVSISNSNDVSPLKAAVEPVIMADDENVPDEYVSSSSSSIPESTTPSPIPPSPPLELDHITRQSDLESEAHVRRSLSFQEPDVRHELVRQTDGNTSGSLVASQSRHSQSEQEFSMGQVHLVPLKAFLRWSQRGRMRRGRTPDDNSSDGAEDLDFDPEFIDMTTSTTLSEGEIRLPQVSLLKHDQLSWLGEYLHRRQQLAAGGDTTQPMAALFDLSDVRRHEPRRRGARPPRNAELTRRDNSNLDMSLGEVRGSFARSLSGEETIAMSLGETFRVPISSSSSSGHRSLSEGEIALTHD